MSPLKRLPLIILHKNGVTGGPAQHPNNKKLLEHWKNSGALYATPPVQTMIGKYASFHLVEI